MLLKNIIDEVSGFRFMIDNLDIKSGIGRRMLLATKFITDEKVIEQQVNDIEYLLQKFDKKIAFEQLLNLLSEIRDIRGSIRNLELGNTLDDIELFEIKTFAITAETIRTLLVEKALSPISLEDLSPIISILDPEELKIPSFYIYDCYSEKLAQIRKQLKATKNEELYRQLFDQSIVLEDEIRQLLSLNLRNYIGLLKSTLHQVGTLDIYVAKARQAKDLNLVKPTLVHGYTTYRKLTNPQVNNTLNKSGKQFQPIDISLAKEIQLITGANMTGKTVLLKTLALCQYLVQFGFFIPAAIAEVSLVNNILVSIGDDQSTETGLSAFASEILKIDCIVKATKKDSKQLVLIDELARTTNPTEGKAIVEATIILLNKLNVSGLVSTHYSNIEVPCKKLRVKGLSQNITTPISKENLADYIDYSLIEDDLGTVPHEAIRIAGLLGVDEALLDSAKERIRKNERN